METPGTQNSQNNLEKYEVGGLTPADFKIYYKAIVKTVWDWEKQRHFPRRNTQMARKPMENATII